MRKLRILVAEDSPDAREMLEAALKAEGFSVETAIDGEDALTRISQAAQSQRGFDAVLLDYAMPKRDGSSCAVAIREQEADGRPQTRIDFFTGHGDLVLPPPLLRKLNARSWSKLNMVEMINDLKGWANCPLGRDRAAAC